MEEGTFAGWQKSSGQWICRGDVLFELEGEKAVQEIEAIDDGTLFIPADGVQTGAVLKVGAVIGYLLAKGESEPSGAVGPDADPADVVVEVNVGHPAAPAAAPSVRRLARELHVPLVSLQGSGRGGRIVEDDVRQAAAMVSGDERGPVATPRARRAAAAHGINWRLLTGSGRNGRIRERDVLATISNSGTPLQPMTQTPPATARWQPLEGRRAVIARRMQESRNRTVPVTLTARAKAGALVSLRDQFRAAKMEPVPAYHDILAKLVAECLTQHLLLGARHERGGILLPDPEQLHLGLAVDAPDGLIVPVLRDVRKRSLRELAVHSADCVARARSGRLTAAEVEGSVFTLSSLGSLGVDGFNPVINYPETAILGVGAIRSVPVVVEGERIAAGHELVLSLTFDHQTIDGAPAARFLKDLVIAVENPAAKLL